MKLGLQSPTLPPAPRAVRLKRSYRILRILLVLAMLGVPAAFVGSKLHAARELWLLADHGVTAEARVENRDRLGSTKSRRFYVEYSFPVGGQRHAARSSVSRGTYDRLEPGTTVTVTYWPDDPQVVRIGRVTAAMAQDEEADGWIGCGGFFALFAVALYVFARAWRRSLVLLADGRVVAGRVVAFESFRSRKKHDRLRYAFRTPAGGEREGTDRLRRKLDVPPEPGTELAVLQMPDDPEVHMSLHKVLEVAELRPDV
ncbi:MAG TPA: DUF3592 domain-containing protein [Planctomycetota bacterium]